jgi:type I restriction enzyme, S subunit
MPNKYKQTEIGLLPSHWEVKKLGEIGKFTKGKGILKDELKEEGLPCIRYGEIYTKYNFNTSKLYSFISDDTSKLSQEISTGDVLMAGSGETIDEIGKAIAYLGTTKAYAGGDIIIFKPTNQNSLTISFLLESDSAKKQKRFMGQGNSVVHIYSSDLQKLKLPIPPLPEQQRIATILSTWDKAIDNVQYIIDNIQLRNKGLLNKLIMDNVNWKKFELGTILDYEQPQDFLTNNFTDVETNIPVLTANKSFILGYTTDTKNIYNKVPVIIFDDFTTASRYIDFNFKIKSSAIKILSVKKGFHLKFTFYLLQTIRTNIAEHKRRWISEFEDKVVKLPSIQEQTAIATILDTAQAELSSYQQKLAQLQLQKKGLMQVLLTGKVLTMDNV